MSDQLYFAATVMGNTLAKAKNKGTPSVKFKFKLLFNTNDPEQKTDGRIVYADLWITFKTIKKTLETLNTVFGWKGHNITDFMEPILYGKKCQLVCEEEEYKGKVRLNVKFINKLGGLQGIDPSELDDLIAEVQPFINEELGIKETVSDASFENIPDASEDEKLLPF